MGRRHRSRLAYHYAIYPLIIIITLVLTTFINSRVLRDAIYDAHRRDLEVVAHVVRNSLPVTSVDDGAAVDAFVNAVSEGTDIRVTVIDENGVVLGDSHADAASMDNHADRPEVRAALTGAQGINVRYSATLQEQLMYAALPIYAPGTSEVTAVVRSSLIVGDLEARLAMFYRRQTVIGVLLIASALFVAFRLSRSIRLPLRALHTAARAYGEGRLEHEIGVDSGPRELITLAITLESTARNLNARIHELEEQRRETEEFLNTIREPLLLLDRLNRIQRANDAAYRFFSSRETELTNRMLLDVFRNSEIDRFVQGILDSELPGETEITTFETPPRRLRVWAVHLTSETSLLQGQTLLLLRDITPEYRIEQIRKDFVANVSHELKTPLTMIQGAVETLTEIPPEQTTERRRFETMIADHTERMSSIVEDLLDLARIEQDDHASSRETIDIVPIIYGSVATIAARYPDREETISVDAEGPMVWEVDPSLIDLALTNLLDNAVRHTPPETAISVGGVIDADELTLRVHDDGPGIPREEQERIFERFYRVDAGRSRRDGGTGLGLSIVRHIALAHGGAATVDSTVGAGSTFTITIPGGSR